MADGVEAKLRAAAFAYLDWLRRSSDLTGVVAADLTGRWVEDINAVNPYDELPVSTVDQVNVRFTELRNRLTGGTG